MIDARAETLSDDGIAERSWGADFISAEAVRFRLWAPAADSLSLRLDGTDIPMKAADDGWFEIVTSAQPGMAYSFLLPDGTEVADPASRFQLDEVDGPSLLIDPSAFDWQCTGWKGRPLEETVIYEMHIGTFTPEGTFSAALAKLAHLKEVGITAIEIMPVAQFRGSRGWGYDGVLLYAPHNIYGTPDDFKTFIDEAHRLGLMVFLDVVYNHFGPDGNNLSRYAPRFFHPEAQTPWGEAIAYERQPVRRFFVDNALYWLREYRLDGLRLDAIDQIKDDDSDWHVLIEIAEQVRLAFPDRHIHLATEDNRNITDLHERSEKGDVDKYSMEWNDDFHHATHVIASGETDGYYGDFATDTVQKLARGLAQGFIFQGEPSSNDGGKPRGVPSGHLPPTAFLNFNQNHDQIGNRAFGERLRALSDDATLRAVMAILLLSPQIPLIFMGEEYGEVQPFRFFTDFQGKLADDVREGRRKEFANLAGFRDNGGSAGGVPDPNDDATFEQSKLDWDRAGSPDGSTWLDFTRRLLHLRKQHIVPLLHKAGPHAGRIVAADPDIVAVAWTFEDEKLQIVANLGDSAKAAPLLEGRLIYATPQTGDQTLLEAKTVVCTVGPAY